jgi:hypothetical protein
VLATALVRSGEKILVLSPTRNQCLLHFDLFVWLAKRRNTREIQREDREAFKVIFDNGCVVHFTTPPLQVIE